MAAERQHRLDDRELKRLLDELARPESEVEVPGKGTLAERIDQLAVRRRAAKSAPKLHPGWPGQRALVGDMLTAAPKLEFSDCRALALRDVLSRLGSHRRLQEETLAAADPHVARRFGRGEHGAQVTPQGQAMWGAANQRAVTLYRRATAAGIGAPETRPVAEAIGSIGTGVPLPADVRRKLEAALGVSLESVRLHTGSVARDAAGAVFAEAFTVGEDIFFPGYDPLSSRCQETLAHEVVHTIQWRQGRITATAGGPGVSRPDDPLEREAEAAAKSIVARAFHGSAEPTRTPAFGRTATNAGRAPTIDRQPAAFPVAMMLGPVSPASASFTGSSAMVMRKTDYGGDRPLEVSAWDVKNRINDLTKSIFQAGPHIAAVGGEFASLLADNWDGIAYGIVIGLLAGAAITALPPVLAKLTLLLLAAYGISNLAGFTGTNYKKYQKHLLKWAHTAWDAHGEPDEIDKAAFEFAQLIASFLKAVAGVLGVLWTVANAAGAVVGPLLAAFARRLSKSTATRPIKEVNPRPQLNERGESNGTSGVPATPSGAGGVPATTGHQSSPGPRLIEDQYREIRLRDGRILVPAGGSPENGESIPEIKQENGITIQLAIEQQLGLPRFSLTIDNNKALSRDVLDRIIGNYAPKGTREEKTKILRAIELAQAEEDDTLAILQLAEKILKGQWRNLGTNTSTFKVFGKGELVRKIVKREPEARDADLVEEQPNEKARKQELNRQRTYIRDYIIDKINILKSSPYFSEYSYLNPTMSPVGSFTIDTTMVVGRTIFDLKGDELTWAESEVERIVRAARQALGKDAAAIDDAPDNFRFHRTERKVVGWFDPVKVGEIPSNVGTEAAVSLGVHGLASLGIDWRYVHPSPKLERLASSGDFWHALGGADDVTQPEQRARAVKKLHNMLSIPGSQFKVLIDAPVDQEVRKAFGHALSLIIKGDPSDRQLAELSRILREAVRAVKTKSDSSPEAFQTADDVTKYLEGERERVKGISVEDLTKEAAQHLAALRDQSPQKNLPGLTPDWSALMATEDGVLTDLRNNGGDRFETVTNEFRQTLGTKTAIEIAIKSRIKDIHLRLTTWAVLEALKSRFSIGRQASQPSTSDAPLFGDVEKFSFALQVRFFLAKHQLRVRGIANNEDLMRQAQQCVEALLSLAKKENLPELVLSPPITNVQELLTDLQNGGGRLQTVIKTLAKLFENDGLIEKSIRDGKNQTQNITGIAWMTFEELERRFMARW